MDLLCKEIISKRKSYLLTVITITISSFLVIFTHTSTNYITSQIQQQFTSMGLNTAMLTILNNEINEEQMNDIKSKANTFICYFSIKEEKYTIIGTDYQFDSIFELNYDAGRFFNEFEQIHNENVVVLGCNTLYLFDYPKINDEIYICGIKYKVIGLLNSDNNVYLDTSNSIFIPSDYFTGNYQRSYFININDDLNNYLGQNDYVLIEQKDTIQTFTYILKLIHSILKFLADSSLVIAMLQLSNQSIMSVKIRKREIAIKKSLGASTIQLLFEFLLENILITLFSLILSIILCTVLFLSFKIEFSFSQMFFQILIICFFSAVFSFIPALLIRKISINQVFKQ